MVCQPNTVLSSCDGPPRHSVEIAVDNERTRRILQIARSMFGRHGFTATTMDEIAGAAGVSKKTIYKLFENKNALFRAVLEARLQNIESCADVPTSCSARQTLRLALQRVVEIVFDAEEVALHRLLIAERHQSPFLVQIFSDVIFGRGADGVVAGLKKVRLKSGIEKLPEVLVADMLLGAVLGKEHFRCLVDGGYAVDRIAIEKRIDEALNLFCEPDLVAGTLSEPTPPHRPSLTPTPCR